MKKTIIYTLLFIIFIGVVLSVIRLKKTNSKAKTKYKTEQLVKMNIVNKVIATGKVIPLEEVQIKPQIAGIVDKVLVEEGQVVKTGDLIATVRVVPNVQSLNSANNEIKNAQMTFNNAKKKYERNKSLYKKGVIARQTFEDTELNFNNAKQRLKNAYSNRDLIKKGTTAGLGNLANTNIRATASGTVVEVPVKKGYQVIQSNNFNAGTTIASIADMNKMIFEGKVDEAEVGKLKTGMPLNITIGAIEDEKITAKLNFIAPKGKEENGAIQFVVKGDLDLTNVKQMVRAGYSANASIIIEKKDSILAVREAIIQYNKETKKPYVEVLKDKEKGEFYKKEVKLGVSDGINVEIISGITKDDKIKVWNAESKNSE